MTMTGQICMMVLTTLLFGIPLTNGLRRVIPGSDNEVFQADEFQRKRDEFAQSTFEPSSDLAERWVKAITSTKRFAKVDQSVSLLPNQCKEDIRNGKTEHSACADPWPQAKDCKASYEVPNYRLGDLFKEKKDTNDGGGPAGNQKWTKFYFPESIGAQYLASKTKARDKEALRAVLDSPTYENYEKPSNDTVVVHLRAFDIYAFGADAGYTLADNIYNGIAKKAKKLGKTKAVIISGDHWLTQRLHGVESNDPNFKKLSDQKLHQAVEASKKKSSAIKDSFTRHGFSVDERINGNADCDFVFMANANLFVPSRGTFGILAASMVQMHGGKVLTAPPTR